MDLVTIGAAIRPETPDSWFRGAAAIRPEAPDSSFSGEVLVDPSMVLVTIGAVFEATGSVLGFSCARARSRFHDGSRHRAASLNPSWVGHRTSGPLEHQPILLRFSRARHPWSPAPDHRTSGPLLMRYKVDAGCKVSFAH